MRSSLFMIFSFLSTLSRDETLESWVLFFVVEKRLFISSVRSLKFWRCLCWIIGVVIALEPPLSWLKKVWFDLFRSEISSIASWAVLKAFTSLFILSNNDGLESWTVLFKTTVKWLFLFSPLVVFNLLRWFSFVICSLLWRIFLEWSVIASTALLTSLFCCKEDGSENFLCFRTLLIISCASNVGWWKFWVLFKFMVKCSLGLLSFSKFVLIIWLVAFLLVLMVSPNDFLYFWS